MIGVKSTERLAIRITPELLGKVESERLYRKVSQSKFVRAALEFFLENLKKERETREYEEFLKQDQSGDEVESTEILVPIKAKAGKRNKS